MTYLRATDLHFSYGPNLILSGVSFSVGAGMRVGVTGPNGSGKSTLLRILAGELAAQSGRIEYQPHDAFVGLVSQEPTPVRGESVINHLSRRTGVTAAEAELRAATAAYTDNKPSRDRYQRALDRWDSVGVADFEVRARSTLHDLGCNLRRGSSGSQDAGLEQVVTGLSGGEMARLELAAVLLHKADVLLLDEPTNNLDAAGLSQLEDIVLEAHRPIVLVSHDRAFLERTVTHVVEIDANSRRSTFHSGGWVDYQRSRNVEHAKAGERHATYVQERQRLRDRVQRERRWADKGTSSAKKSDEPDRNVRSFNLASAEARGSAAAKTKDKLARLQPVDKPFEGWELKLTLGEKERAGSGVAVLDAVVVNHGDFTLGPLDLRLRAGDRVLISGSNGSGKSTLVNVITGEADLASGTCVIGPSVEIGVLSQVRDRFGSTEPLLDAFCELTGSDPEGSRSALAKFGLGAEHVQRIGESLSPGERTRAVLAEFQHRGVNLLILDEPTNHLDLEAIEQLEYALGPFGGTLMVISHDERFRGSIEFQRELTLVQGRLDRSAGTISS